MPRTASATPTIPYAAQTKYRTNNPEKVKDTLKRYYERNKAKLQEKRRTRYHSVEKPRKMVQKASEQIAE